MALLGTVYNQDDQDHQESTESPQKNGSLPPQTYQTQGFLRPKKLFTEGPTPPLLFRDMHLPCQLHYRVNHACVLFFDIVGYTALSEKYEDALVLDYIVNPLFTRFDTLVQKHNAKKVSTQGDGYMAAIVIEVESTDTADAKIETHMAIRCIELAQKMLEEINFLNQQLTNKKTFGNFELKGRIGINLGACEKLIDLDGLKEDLVGKMVNAASRIESSSKPGKIHVSQSVYKAAYDFYHFEEDVQDLKGIGAVKCYYVKGPNISNIPRKLSLQCESIQNKSSIRLDPAEKKALKRTYSLPHF